MARGENEFYIWLLLLLLFFIRNRVNWLIKFDKGCYEHSEAKHARSFALTKRSFVRSSLTCPLASSGSLFD